MNKYKKLTLGTLSSVTAIAIPVFAVVACDKGNGLKPSDYDGGRNDHVDVKTNDNKGVSLNYKMLPTQSTYTTTENNPITYIMEKGADGKLQFKDAKDIEPATLRRNGKILMDVTLSDYIKSQVEEQYKKIKNNREWDKTKLNIIPGKNLMKFYGDFEFTVFNSKFFEPFTTPENAKKLAALFNKVAKDSVGKSDDFKIKFNFVMPKYLNHFDYINANFVEQQIEKVTYAAGLNHPKLILTAMGDKRDIYFDYEHLPSQTISFRIYGFFNHTPIRPFDFSKAPKDLITFKIVSGHWPFGDKTASQKAYKEKFIKLTIENNKKILAWNTHNSYLTHEFWNTHALGLPDPWEQK